MARFESNATTSRDKLHSTPDVVYTFGGLSNMPEALELHAKIKELIVEVLMLEDVVPTDIESNEPLFIDGLGLDSIDALELAMGLEDEYGVVITDNPEKNEKIFMSVSSLAEFVVAERSK
jgi:acyl carrier protein